MNAHAARIRLEAFLCASETAHLFFRFSLTCWVSSSRFARSSCWAAFRSSASWACCWPANSLADSSCCSLSTTVCSVRCWSASASQSALCRETPLSDARALQKITIEHTHKHRLGFGMVDLVRRCDQGKGSGPQRRLDPSDSLQFLTKQRTTVLKLKHHPMKSKRQRRW